MTDIRSIDGPKEAGFGDFVQLLKPRVMSLVVFTALVGLLVAPVSLHPVESFAAILFIALGAGASGALNMWWDADIDVIMRRTKSRPVPSGLVQPGEALGVGMALSGISVVMLALATNILAGALLFDVAETFDPAEHRHWRCCRGLSADDRLGRGHRVGFHRSRVDVHADLHVDAAAFLGAGAVHE
jgi:hypothetical protein